MNFIDWIKEVFINYEDSFDFVYIISHRFCILYDVKKNGFDEVPISCDENQLLCKIARMTAENEITLADIEWN